MKALDPERRRARTRSGRVYELGHGPGLNAGAFCAWGQWKARYSLQQERDISDEIAALLGQRST